MKEYTNPTVVTLGTVEQLTQVDKCHGSGDTAYPQILENRFAPDNTC